MKKLTLLSPMLIVSLFFSGCAKGPSIPPPPAAPNRLSINMTLQQAMMPNFYYDFAFDDDGEEWDGPSAIIGTTTLANGVVGGSFRVLVQCRGGKCLAFRRTDLGNGQETLEPASRAFVGVPSARGNTINFTLDLDATVDNAADPPTAADRLFAAGVTKLDVNFVTANISGTLISPGDNSRKAFDAFFPTKQSPLASAHQTFLIATTRTIRNVDTVREPANDTFEGDFSSVTAQQLAALDITNFVIDVQRRRD